MTKLNVEIKARCAKPERIRDVLESNRAEYVGLDHQIDTYLNYPIGRLKLRKGNIENALIFYEREDILGPKKSKVRLFNFENYNEEILKAFSSVFGIKVVVDKYRHIYFIDNVKFHIDSVKDLGSFLEIEAISNSKIQNREELLKQCNAYKNLLRIKEKDLINKSYSDLLLEKRRGENNKWQKRSSAYHFMTRFKETSSNPFQSKHLNMVKIP